jgi:hypothetical protein
MKLKDGGMRMSKEKTLKERLESLEDEIRSLKFVCSRLADVIEQDFKLRIIEEEHLTKIYEILTRMANATITIDAKVLQSIYAMVTNALNDTGLVRVLHKLDDSTWRLSEALKKQFKIKEESERKRDFLMKKILEKIEES